MNKLFNQLSILAFLSFSLFACKPSTTTSTTTTATDSTAYQLSDNQKITFLSKVDGGITIAKDEKEGFFDKIQILDMHVQMKEAVEGDRSTVLKAYQEHLKASVLAFSKEDKTFINEVFDEAYQLCNNVDSRIFPAEILLIKTDMNHYGPGTYYTRENAIIIPANVLKEQDKEAFLSTMLHEIFHIYSRYNTEKQKALYARIGFEKIPAAQLPDALAKRVLLNPDGVDFNYAVDVNVNKDAIAAIPIIYTKFPNLQSKPLPFFAYLNFALFEVKDGKVIATEEGEAPFSIRDANGFFEQIGDNTQYIIHPDEVLADNFILMAMATDKDKKQQQLSPKGKQLLADLEKIIKK